MNYSELTRRYFETAGAAGVLSGGCVGRGAAGTRRAGTWVQFDIQLEPGGEPQRRILAARFLAFGCPHTIAVAAWVCERAAGTFCAAALPETAQALCRRFEVPAEKLGRLLVIEDAWATAAAAAQATARVTIS